MSRIVSKKLRDSARGQSGLDWKSGLPYDVIRENRRRHLEALLATIQSEEGAVFLVDYPGYLVTPAGDVYSTGGSRLTKLRPGKKRGGYRFVGIRGCKYEMVHRLVAKAFIPNPGQMPEVNHKDGNKDNNAAANLEWCTRAQNARHAVDNGLASSGVRHYQAKLTAEQVMEIFYADGRYRQIGQRFGICAQSVCNIKKLRTYREVLRGVEA